MNKRIWITWENQRRSRELAAHFDCRFFVFQESGPLRYPRVIVRTIATLLRERPAILFVQNPSMVLAALAVAVGVFAPLKVVVDRHTTFLLNYQGPDTLPVRAFRLLSWLTLRYADLTLVTNEPLARLVREAGGRVLVLPDKVPLLQTEASSRYPVDTSVPSVMFVCSFASDEPIEEVISAARILAGNTPFHLYVTGRPRPSFEQIMKQAPPQVRFTGFISDHEYVSMLQQVDVVMVLTTSDCTMLCGCYEAVAAAKPLVTSDKDVLRNYFVGALFTQPHAAAIADALSSAIAKRDELKEVIRELRPRLDRTWSEASLEVERSIQQLARA